MSAAAAASDLNVTGWDDEATAERYADFARQHRMYRSTSADLVSRAGLHPAATVLDLCAGTGVTTELILQELGPDGHVVAFDGSAAMLAQHARLVADPRVTLVLGEAEGLAEVPDVDAVLCNSACWQTRIPEATRAVARVLRPGGRFVFNIGRPFLMLPFTQEELERTIPGLVDVMCALAVLEHGYVAPMTARMGGARPLTVDGVLESLTDAGFTCDEPERIEHEQGVDDHAAWLRVPIFTERVLPGVPYATRMRLLDQALALVDREAQPDRVMWLTFIAIRGGE